MVDRVDNQAPKSEEERATTVASNRSVEDAYDGFRADEGSSRSTLLTDARIPSDKAAPPTKLPADGVKPEPDAAARGLQKVVPDNAGTAPREAQASRDGVTPMIHPGDKALVPPTNPGANPKVNPEVTPKAGEQQRASTDGVHRVQNSVENPTSQRPADAVSTQPVSNSVKAPERPPDRLSPSPTEQQSDRALLPGLAIVGPEGKAQQGSVATVGTSDGKVHDPVLPKPQEAATVKANDVATPKAEVSSGKASDIGLRGSEPGTGALTGKIQAGPDQVKSDDSVRFPGAHVGDAIPRQANGESVLKNFSAADGTRSGIDHTVQGIIAKGADAKGLDSVRDGKLTDGKLVDGKSPDGKADGIRSGPVSLTDGKIAEGKIADGKFDGDRAQTRLPDGRMLDGKIGDGSTAGAKPGDRLPDGKVGGKTGGDGGSSGPSAFIQFIESQAGIRGFGLPAKSENNKSEGKADSKNDSKSDGKADGTKTGSANTDGKAFVPVGAKGDSKGSVGVPVDTKNSIAVPGDIKGGASIPGGRSNAIDGFLGLVETVKDNIKGSLKNLGDRTQPSVPLKEGELAAVAMRGKMPPVRDDITSEQILAVLIPKGLVGWSIVRAPGIKPSDSPLPGSQTKIDGAKVIDSKVDDGKLGTGKLADGKSIDTKQLDTKHSEPKPFDINNPDVKSRPFIQLHGVDSNYTGAGVRRTEPVAPVKAEPLTDTKVAAAPAAATPYLDVSTTNPANQIADQSATRQTIPAEPKSRRQLIEEQEHTLPSASEADIAPTKEGEKRLRYVNSALDAQEATWNSEEDAANNGRELQAPLGRYTYIVRAGDTIESVAVVELNDLSLAPLLFKKNKKYVLPEEEYGRHPLVVGVVIDLPTPAEIKAFRQF
ncbi:hypothetical protein KBI23_27240 [bacterium]|nr:hypothetical protein [bacterium]